MKMMQMRDKEKLRRLSSIDGDKLLDMFNMNGPGFVKHKEM